jgi:hypothetical protein
MLVTAPLPAIALMSALDADPRQRHKLSVAEYYRMAEAGILGPGQRCELIEGEVIDMSPIGSRHGGAVKYLNQTFVLAAEGRAIVSTQDPVGLSPFSEPQPTSPCCARATISTAARTRARKTCCC